MAEEPTSDDEIVGTVQLEKQRLTGGKSAEGAGTTQLPEIHLVGAKLRQVVKPLRIGDGDEEPHLGSIC